MRHNHEFQMHFFFVEIFAIVCVEWWPDVISLCEWTVCDQLILLNDLGSTNRYWDVTKRAYTHHFVCRRTLKSISPLSCSAHHMFICFNDQNGCAHVHGFFFCFLQKIENKTHRLLCSRLLGSASLSVRRNVLLWAYTISCVAKNDRFKFQLDIFV